MLMVKAGPAVDSLIGQLLPLLEPGDILIDGGNSDFKDTNRRVKDVEGKGYLFVGAGVSGGEEGALKGPSIMPGGSEAAWPHVKTILQKISAKVGVDEDVPCCEWVGPGGSGHYVKMVHNGIEYGDMQLICEAYFLLKEALGLSNDDLYAVFDSWNKSELESYLIEITRDIFTVKEPDGSDLVDKILGHGPPEGDRQVDEPARPRPGRADDAHHRGRLRPLPVGPEGGPRPGVEDPRRADGEVLRRQRRVHRGRQAGAVRLEAGELRPGLRAARRGGPRVRLEAQQRQHRAALAGRLHHPQPVPGGHQGRGSTRTTTWRTCCSTPSSSRPSRRPSRAGGGSSRRA